jgi:hypothetical protein
LILLYFQLSAAFDETNKEQLCDERVTKEEQLCDERVTKEEKNSETFLQPTFDSSEILLISVLLNAPVRQIIRYIFSHLTLFGQQYSHAHGC